MSRRDGPEVRIAPSILSADFAKLGEAVREAEAGGADWIHVDVMDGHFVPNLTIGPPVVAALRRVTDLPLDVHLMVDRPENMLAMFCDAGADYVTIHVEASIHVHRTIQRIRELGAAPGVSLNPGTSVDTLRQIAAAVDLILVMSVDPGFGGQPYIPSSTDKIAEAARLIQAVRSPALLAVDGGIGPANAREVVVAGARVLVAGASVFGHDDVPAAIAGLRAAATRVEV